jgi:glycine cleavage system pyridoxal-binding protein P
VAASARRLLSSAAPAASGQSGAAAAAARVQGVDLFKAHDVFEPRHLGPSGKAEQEAMLKVIGMASVEELVDKTVPRGIRKKSDTHHTKKQTPPAAGEAWQRGRQWQTRGAHHCGAVCAVVRGLMSLPAALSEQEALAEFKQIMGQNEVSGGTGQRCKNHIRTAHGDE